jgi:hypothetical protein
MLDSEQMTSIAIWADSGRPKEFFDFANDEESEFFDKCRRGKLGGGVTVYPAELPAFGKIGGFRPVVKD